MQFTKQSFMGIELDILIGHPEHELLFVATQVARCAGLKNPSQSIAQHIKRADVAKVRASDVDGLHNLYSPSLQARSWLFPEATVYQTLLRGHAPASEPFRKWVTEVVLPSIRKTGKFDVNEAQDDTSKQFAGELAALHDVIKAIFREETSDIRAMLKELMERPAVVLPEAQPSPYGGRRH